MLSWSDKLRLLGDEDASYSTNQVDGKELLRLIFSRVIESVIRLVRLDLALA